MKNLELTPVEKIELEKRGFFVKNLFSFTAIAISFPIFLLFHVMSLTIMSIPTSILLFFNPIGSMIFYVIFNQSIFIYFMSKYFITYVFRGKIFLYINKKGSVSSITKKGGIFFLELYHSFKGTRLSKDSRNTLYAVSSLVFIFLPILMCYVCFLYFEENFAILNFHPYDDYLYPLIAVFIGFYIFGYIARQLVEHFHPLYIFDNLGEKIQKLTPAIEEQSKKIQSEFESTMDFSVLSHGFDLLSRNFSKIVQLIIKLENAEKRANQGNLFDSEKYINSLRSDIVTPLISLKTFLEEKKIELIQSKQELTRVQVGGTEESGNIELQSKRSESLIQELTENIEKLDVMIGKIG